MNCKVHPTAEAVTTCAVCGAGMCSQCDAGAFARLEENDQPLCMECALKQAEENVNFGEHFLKSMKIKLIFASILICLSIFFFVAMDDEMGIFEDKGLCAICAFLFWFLSGFIQTRGHEKIKGSVKSIFWEDSDPDGFSFYKVIFYIFAGPVMLIRNFIKYPKLKASHKLDIQKYEEIKAALSAAN